MTDALLHITLNDANETRLAFVQGEDRRVPITIHDGRTGRPVDLTGSILAVTMPAALGGPVRRSTGAIPVSTLARTGAEFTVAGHGLVTGDIVRVAANAGATLPGGLAPMTDYTVRKVGRDTLVLQQAGADVVPSSSGSGGFGITLSGGLEVDDPTFGHAVLILRSWVTAAAHARDGQDIEVSITGGDGLVRMAVLRSALDVLARPYP